MFIHEIKIALCTCCCLFLTSCLHTCYIEPTPEEIEAYNRKSEENFLKSRERIEKKIEKGEINFPLPSDSKIDSKQ